MNTFFVKWDAHSIKFNWEMQSKAFLTILSDDIFNIDNYKDTFDVPQSNIESINYYDDGTPNSSVELLLHQKTTLFTFISKSQFGNSSTQFQLKIKKIPQNLTGLGSSTLSANSFDATGDSKWVDYSLQIVELHISGIDSMLHAPYYSIIDSLTLPKTYNYKNIIGYSKNNIYFKRTGVIGQNFSRNDSIEDRYDENFVIESLDSHQIRNNRNDLHAVTWGALITNYVYDSV